MNSVVLLQGHIKSSSACTPHQNMDSILWLHSHVMCVRVQSNVCVCVWPMFFPQLTASLVCRFLWVWPHQLQLWRPSREEKLFPFISNLQIILVWHFYQSLTPPTLPPPLLKSLYLYFFLLNPHTTIPSLSLSVSPCSLPLPLCRNWKQLWRGYYSS